MCDSVWSPLHSSEPTSVFVTEGSTMDSAVPIGDNTNCSRALHNSNICRQDQPVSGKPECFILRQLGPTECDQGIPYSLHCRSSSKVSPYGPHLPSGDVIVLHSLLQKQAIQQIPSSAEGLYSNMFLVPRKGEVRDL